jgi:phytoene synthase
MRLVQLLSSIGSDFKRGRVYVPQEDLARFRYSERKIAAATIDESFERLLAFESQRAGAILQSSSALIPWIAEPGGRIAATALMLHTVARLRRIIIRSAAAFAASPRHTMLDTLRLLPTAWRVSRRAAAGELPRLLRAATDSTMARCP